MIRAVKIHKNDNVATVIEPARRGDHVIYPDSGESAVVEAGENITIYHKIALKDIPAGSPVIKYGEVIGIATAPIHTGDLVHVHNLKSAPEGAFRRKI